MRGGKVLSIAMLVLLVTVGAGGTQPQAINFLSQVNVSTPLPFTGTWAASGTINDSGTLSEPTVFLSDGQLHIVRICTGAKGQITIKIQSKITNVTDNSATFVGEWVIESGSGAYARLHGQGGRAAVAIDGTVTETLTGEAHFD
jgi:hypothetical protein